MFARFRLILDGCFQFAATSVLLAFSFLIQHRSLDALVHLPWLASAIAAPLVVGRILVACYRHSRPPPLFSIALLLDSFRLASSILALSCSVGFFFDHLQSFDPEASRAAIRLYPPQPMRTAWLLALSLVLGLLLELALAVMLGHLARTRAALSDAEPDYSSRRDRYLARAEEELRLAGDAGRDLRRQVIAERERIERRLRQAVADASAGKLAG